MATQLNFQNSQELFSRLQTMMWISNNTLTKPQVKYVNELIELKQDWLNKQCDKKLGRALLKIGDCGNIDNDLQVRLKELSDTILRNYNTFKLKTSTLFRQGMYQWLSENLFNNLDWISFSHDVELLITIKEAVDSKNLRIYESEIMTAIDTALTRYFLQLKDPVSDKKMLHIQKLRDQQSEWLADIAEKEPKVGEILSRYSK